MTAFEANMNSGSKRLKSGATLEMQKVDSMTWDWFTSKRGDGMSISGPLLQEKALFFAASMGLTDFKASNGWLQRFKVSDNNHFCLLCSCNYFDQIRRCPQNLNF